MSVELIVAKLSQRFLPKTFVFCFRHPISTTFNCFFKFFFLLFILKRFSFLSISKYLQSIPQSLRILEGFNTLNYVKLLLNYAKLLFSMKQNKKYFKEIFLHLAVHNFKFLRHFAFTICTTFSNILNTFKKYPVSQSIRFLV